MIDNLGRPKSVWHALKRAFRPVQVLISDEGVNGLHLHALNDSAEPIAATLSLSCLRDGRLAVASAERAIFIPARGAVSISASALLGRFFDTNYAYRFGPPEHDVCLAQLARDDGVPLAEASFWLPGMRVQRQPLGLVAAAERDGTGWVLRLSCERMAASVAIDDENLVAEDNHFDLAPGRDRLIRLRPRAGGGEALPAGEITAINGHDRLRYAAKA